VFLIYFIIILVTSIIVFKKKMVSDNKWIWMMNTNY
jgi:hypothetical protein